MDGGGHETIIADVYSNLADTYLLASSNEAANIDCLENAQRHLDAAERVLFSVLTKSERKEASDDSSDSDDYIKELNVGEIIVQMKKETQSPPRKGKIFTSPKSNSNSNSNEIEVEVLSTQLHAIYTKLIDITLTLTTLHLKTYASSSVMICLRKAANSLKAQISLTTFNPRLDMQNLLKQVSRVWELSGELARSYAADDAWIATGHTSCDDVISLLLDIEKICSSFSFSKKMSFSDKVSL